MTRGIPIEDYLRKGGMEGMGRKVLVIRAYRSHEEVTANWMADQCLKAMRSQDSDLEISDMAVSAFRVLGGVTNDPDDDAFDPKDQLPLFLEPLAAADVVLLVGPEALGLPAANLVRVTERLQAALAAKDVPDILQKAFAKPKQVGVLMYGGPGVMTAGMTLAGAWVHFGCALPRKGIVHWEGSRGEAAKSSGLTSSLANLARNLLVAPRDRVATSL